jgi:RNA polymerase sigma factor (TIGR02999 family)
VKCETGASIELISLRRDNCFRRTDRRSAAHIESATRAWIAKRGSIILAARMDEADNVTGLLLAWSNGDEHALERLSPYVYRELRRLARRYMAAEGPRHTLQATALVNEAFVRLIDGDIDFESRKHFYVIAARMMRRVLVDHARSKNREKRGAGAIAVTFVDEGRAAADDERDLPILVLDEALSALADSDPRMAQAIELIYFGGLSIDEAGKVLGVSRTTVYEDVRFAKAWLKNQMTG